MNTSTDTFDRLVALGAPAIAEPRFYRIKLTDAGLVRVELRERGRTFGSELLAATEVDTRRMSPASVPDAVVGACVTVVTQASSAEVVDGMLGDFGAEEVAA